MKQETREYLAGSLVGMGIGFFVAGVVVAILPNSWFKQ